MTCNVSDGIELYQMWQMTGQEGGRLGPDLRRSLRKRKTTTSMGSPCRADGGVELSGWHFDGCGIGGMGNNQGG